MSMVFVDPGGGLSANTTLVLEALETGPNLETLALPQRKLSRSDRRRIEQQLGRFAHTPEPLVESWRVAQMVIASTEPRDVIVIGDGGGLGGMLALMQSTLPADRQRQIWTTAGDGDTLETLAIGGTIEHVELPAASTIDWEIVQYRNSALVLATSSEAIALLARVGVGASLAPIEREPVVARPDGRESTIWVPGPVSRRNRSGDVLRAIASNEGLSATVSTADVADLIWNGTTWESLSGVRGLLGARLSRAEESAERPGFIVLGDALAPPDASTRAWRSAGVPIAAARGSVAEAMWPEVSTWGTSDELAEVLAGGVSQPRGATAFWNGFVESKASSESRARRVSVGVPVFRNVAYLGECIESILGQTERPREIILIDDGSDLAEVDRALDGWVERRPDLIRVLKQPNRGVCVARNRIIEEMTGDAFVLVDQDDTLDPDFIQRTSEALRQSDSIWAVATWTEFFGEYEGVEAKPPFDWRVGRRENPIVSTAALVDMRVRDAGIGFAPDMAFLFCEDWHFWSQIIAAGGRMGLVPEPLVRHRVHMASGGFQRTELAHRVGKARAIEPLVAMSRGSMGVSQPPRQGSADSHPDPTV